VPRRINKGAAKQLAEIAKIHRSFGVFQEWSELKNNQRLDFLLLFHQGKSRRKETEDLVNINL
jgi:hypothetical protein